MKYSKALLLSFVMAAAFACSSDPVELRLTQLGLQGRLERGSTIEVIASRGTVPLIVEPGSIVVTPAGSATLLPDGRLRLDSIGPISVQARSNNRTLLVTATVTAPPTVWFHMRVSGNRDIYSVSLDGRDLARLTNDAADDHDPAVSAARMVFVSERSGSGDLFSATLAGASVTRITETPDVDASPALTADGTRVVFMRGPAGASQRLWTANSDGTNAVAAVTGSFSGAIEADPSWCSNAKIVFMSTDNGGADLFLLQNGAVSQLYATDAPEVEPSCNATGSRIAFTFAEDNRSHVAMLNVATGVVTPLTSGSESDGSPTFLADGRIVFIRFVPNGGTLMWLDPAAPETLHTIPLPSTTAGAPSAIR